MSKHPTVLPYHFVPVVKQKDRPGDLPHDEVRDGRHPRLFHSHYDEAHLSGRVLCRLKTITPLVLGSERKSEQELSKTKDELAHVEPFRLDDEPALPGSSLRGMVSAVAEAASNGTLRVLEDRAYSYRKRVESPLREVGMVVQSVGKKYAIRPLGPYEKTFAISALDVEDQCLTTWRKGRQMFYGLEQGSAEGASPVLWKNIKEDERSKYKKGVVRILKTDPRDLPKPRKYELFIPCETDPLYSDPKRDLPIREAALERFYHLADERTEASKNNDEEDLPYEPVGTQRNDLDPADRRFRVKEGDLVFYRSERGEVTELALSMIWRGRVEGADGEPRRAWSFFEAVDRDLVPCHSRRCGGNLTLVEQLFGFVSDDRILSEAGIPALASRLRFSFGYLATQEEEPFLDPGTLRILDSPKPPSPNFYFCDFKKPTSLVAKDKLKPATHWPQGRKFYLHQEWDPESDPKTWPWRTQKENERRNMKARVEPLRRDLSFFFHLDFDNLSKEELGLLLYSLRPTAAYRHKLGMGKPLGLGSVQIDVLGLFEIDRRHRYRRQGLFAPRYAHTWLSEAGAEFFTSEAAEDLTSGELGQRYAAEIEAATTGEAGQAHLSALTEGWRACMDPAVRLALERLGEESFSPEEVSVPLVDAPDAGPEEKTYRWYAENDHPKQPHPRRLQPLSKDEWQRFPRHKATLKD